MDAIRSERLSRGQLALFSLPMLTIEAIEIPWRSYLPVLFTETLTLPLAAVGTLLLSIRLLGLILDPLVGWASDRLPTPFGLRRPWMVLSVPLIVLGAWQVFLAAPGTSLARITVGCVILHAGYTLMATPHGGWSLELAHDPHERTRIMLARMWTAIAGTLPITFLPSLLEQSMGANLQQQVSAMGMLLIVLAPASVSLVVYSFAEPDVNRNTAVQVAGPLRQFLEILRNRELRAVVVLYVLAALMEASSAGTFIFFRRAGSWPEGLGKHSVVDPGPGYADRAPGLEPHQLPAGQTAYVTRPVHLASCLHGARITASG